MASLVGNLELRVMDKVFAYGWVEDFFKFDCNLSILLIVLETWLSEEGLKKKQKNNSKIEFS